MQIGFFRLLLNTTWTAKSGKFEVAHSPDPFRRKFFRGIEHLYYSDGNSDKNFDGNSDFEWEFPSEK